MTGIDIGFRVGRLTVISREDKIGVYHRYRCLCDCGETKVFYADALRRGTSKSCGCRARELTRQRWVEGKQGAIFHRESDTAIWRAWRDMKSRCLNKNNPRFADYGGRGIWVCERWMDFKLFAEDMRKSWAPGLQLDRVDNGDGYHKDNCRWVTHSQNQNNKRCTVWLDTPEGRITLTEACVKYGLKRACINYRLQSGRSGIDLIAPSQRAA